jgi:hypothetical protein
LPFLPEKLAPAVTEESLPAFTRRGAVYVFIGRPPNRLQP